MKMPVERNSYAEKTISLDMVVFAGLIIVVVMIDFVFWFYGAMHTKGCL